ncbi:MAG: hypothetical protein ACI9R3_003302 [Verrucomicrobiales bacterium]|jgi:hypothetical protein
MNRTQTIRIFISSPGDVGPEREIAREVIGRLNERYRGKAELEPYFWEHEPHLSGRDFTTSIGSTADYDLMVVILWKRLGSRLHGNHSKPDGSPFESGTEYEVLTALEAQKEEPVGLPELAVFVNETKATTDLGSDSASIEQEQYQKLLSFIQQVFNREEEDGTMVNEQAYTTYPSLDKFEELVTRMLEGIIVARVGELSAGEQRLASRVWKENPYRGLEVFDFEHKQIFFGRTRAIGEALEKSSAALASGCGYLQVIGSSGAGKSSLVRPGVIEGIALWRYALLKPSDGGSDPFRALAAALLRDKDGKENDSDKEADPMKADRPAALPELRDLEAAADADQTALLAGELARHPESVASRIKDKLGQTASEARIAIDASLREQRTKMEATGRTGDVQAIGDALAALEPPKARLVLVVDQLEELFTGETDAQTVKDFVRALDALARCGRCLVITTLRADFRGAYLDAEGFADLSRDGQTLELTAPNQVELGQIIREPAALAGQVFENHSELGHLDQRILEAAANDPDSLPLLEYCLSELYREGWENGTLEHHEYEANGRLEGALAKRAEETYRSLIEDHRRDALN